MSARTSLRALFIVGLALSPVVASAQGGDDLTLRPVKPQDEIGYERRVAEALRSVVRDVLTETARRGSLLGEHHFYITFRTGADGVVLSDTLRAGYPVEMTVVLQYEFENLAVEGGALAVDLRFSGRRERVRIPFTAMTAFYDPSVNFSVRLTLEDEKTGGAPAPGR